jgi:hypothetical protein
VEIFLGERSNMAAAQPQPQSQPMPAPAPTSAGIPARPVR